MVNCVKISNLLNFIILIFFNYACIYKMDSLRASSPIWASETSLARTRERAAKPRGSLARLGPSAPRSRVLTRFASLAQIGELTRRL